MGPRGQDRSGDGREPPAPAGVTSDQGGRLPRQGRFGQGCCARPPASSLGASVSQAGKAAESWVVGAMDVKIKTLA